MNMNITIKEKVKTFIKKTIIPPLDEELMGWPPECQDYLFQPERPDIDSLNNKITE